MASPAKKKASKKPAKPKAQKKKAAHPKASTARAKTARPAKKTASAPKKQGSRKAPARAPKASKVNHVRKSSGPSQISAAILPVKNNKEKRLDPFTRSQKDKLLHLRDAMVDSMAGVAKDNLRSRAEGSEASAFGMHQADAGSDAYDRDFALSLLSQEQDALYEIDQALKRIELGTYGTCEMSGKSISHARLEAIPFARFTVECQSKLEKQNKASRVRQSVTSLFGLTDEEGAEGEEEEAKADDSKD
ncbi:MAG TPA: TraR/DksA C4-type zinc finger protein [Chthoniobacterales bacterium]|nr:TraR/DksA C4-type zinc finger protein [Chthoniobacterales bacterium]